MVRKSVFAVAAIAALALGGSALAGAATSHSTTGSSARTARAGQAPPAMNGPAHGTAAHENAERAVTGDVAAEARAAAVKSVGSGSAGDVTTDLPGTGYETTVTKADGTKVEVHLDGSFAVMTTPPGGPGGRGRGHGGPPPTGSAPQGAPQGYGG